MGISCLRQSTKLEENPLSYSCHKISMVWCKVDTAPADFRERQERVRAEILPALHREDSNTFRCPPNDYMGAQENSAPSVGTSHAFKDQDKPRPKKFSDHSKTGFLSSEVFAEKFIPALFLGRT